MAVALEGGGDVLHAKRFDAEEGTEAESLVAWNRTKEQDVHGRLTGGPWYAAGPPRGRKLYHGCYTSPLGVRS